MKIAEVYRVPLTWLCPAHFILTPACSPTGNPGRVVMLHKTQKTIFIIRKISNDCIVYSYLVLIYLGTVACHQLVKRKRYTK